MKRRDWLKAGLSLGVAAVLPRTAFGSEAPLTVSAFGGFFEETLSSSLAAAFTEESGIPVQTASQPGGDEWLFGLVRATRAGLAPVDLSIFAAESLGRAMKMGGVFQPLDRNRLPNTAGIDPVYSFEHNGQLMAQGVMSWYLSLVYNPELVDPAPTSWRQLFEEPRFENRLGLISPFNLGLPEIVAATYFEGRKTIETDFRSVVDKAAELKSQVRLWWANESQMEQALRNNEVYAGTYYHDVARLLAEDGYSLVSTFPEEGAFANIGHLALLSTSTKAEQAHRFIDFCARPESQAMLARAMGLAPVRSGEDAGLSGAEFDRVSSVIPPIRPASDYVVANSSRMQRTWQRMLTG